MSITLRLSAATACTPPMQPLSGCKSKRSEQDRDSRVLSSRKCRKFLLHTLIPDRELCSERRIRIVAGQVIRYLNEAAMLGYSSENLLALFYISAYSQLYPGANEEEVRDYSKKLLQNLDISQRCVIYKVLPLMDGEFGQKMRFIAAPILYHLPKDYDYEVFFKYSVREILQEGLELSQNLLKCREDDFDSLCAKLEIESLKGHNSKEKRLCIETWNSSLGARLTLLNHDYEVQLPKYEIIEIYDKDTQPPSYLTTQLFNVYDFRRPNQVKQPRNPAWIFSSMIEGLNMARTVDAQGYFSEELRINDPLIKMTEGRRPRTTFCLLSILHEMLEGSAKRAIETISKIYEAPEAFQLPYTAFNLELDFLKGRMSNFRPIHWPALNDSPFLQEIPSWSLLSEILAADRHLPQGVTFDIPAEKQEESSDQGNESSSQRDTSSDLRNVFNDDFLLGFSQASGSSGYGFDETSFFGTTRSPDGNTNLSDGDEETSSSFWNNHFNI